jgi:hypothetical protein
MRLYVGSPTVEKYRSNLGCAHIKEMRHSRIATIWNPWDEELEPRTPPFTTIHKPISKEEEENKNSRADRSLFQSGYPALF